MRSKLTRTKTGGIYKRENAQGPDSFVATWTSPTGKTVKRTAKTYGEAKALKTQAEAAKTRGEGASFVLANSLTVHAWLDEWAESYKGRGRRQVRANTLADYRSDLRWAKRFYGPRVKLSAVNRDSVAQFLGWLAQEPGERGKPMAASTVKRRVAPFRIALADAVDRGLIAVNPCTGIVIPVPERIEEDEDRVRALSREQAQALIAGAAPEYRTLLRFAIETGVRASELVALQWRHVDLDPLKPHVVIRRAYVRGTMGPPKSRHGRRSIPLSAGLAAELQALRRSAGGVLVGHPLADQLVFANRAGGIIDQGNLRRRVLRPACKAAGLEPMGLHVLRHTAASLMFASGKNAKQVQAILGHHSAAFTLQVYVHLLDGDLGDPLDVGTETGPDMPGMAEPETVPLLPGSRDAGKVISGSPFAADTREDEPAVEVRPHLTLVESA